MKPGTNKYFAILTVSSLILANTALSFAESGAGMEAFSLRYDPENFSSGFEEVAQETAEIPEVSETSTEKEEAEVDKEVFLERVKQELNLSKTDYKQLLNSISDTKTRLELVGEEQVTLKEQLKNLDEQIAFSNGKLVSVIGQLVEKENQIILIQEEIEVKEVALNYQKILLKDYIRTIYEEENKFFSIDEDGEVDAFKLLLSDGTVGENLQKLEYFELLNEAGQQIIDKLNRLFKELEAEQGDLAESKDSLALLQAELANEKDQLELQKESKEKLLQITLGREEIYTQLLAQTLKEQEQLIGDIKNLSNAVNFIDSKIKNGADFDPNDYKMILDYKTQVLYDFHLRTLGLENDDFVWPVDPNRGISAYFRDPRYVGVFGVQHNAVDIPAYQGTPVRAAADGVVYTARDNGYGYSYIIIAHAGGVLTVYGHLSNILVEEAQTLAKGSIIGLSGGMPGTLGAGYMTTGPHLHFEVHLNGLYTDPLEYLPLNVLTVEQIDGLPEKYYDDWESSILDNVKEPLLRF
ncbi:MAG: peptidoglycan DD-metalloendopeptidase family protein [bacterium]|nr:peptidoglycan DD-metalloendopeptidase family protein [bacterium]